MNEAGEVDGAPIVAYCEAAAMLEAAEALLDPIALLVEFGVVRDEELALALGRDHRLRIHLGDGILPVYALQKWGGTDSDSLHLPAVTV